MVGWAVNSVVRVSSFKRLHLGTSGCDRLPEIDIPLPSPRIERQEAGDGFSGKFQTALQPRLPADIAARYKCLMSVNDDEFGMHDAEWEEEEALHPKVDARRFHKFRVRETELPRPRRGWVQIAISGLRMEQLLQD